MRRAIMRGMRVAVPHHTTKAKARATVDQKFQQFLGEFGQHAADLQHEWQGDTFRFKGKARGFTIEGTAEVTDEMLVVEMKLPLLARAFEPRIRQTVEREAEAMFRAG
jgi:hypothetical protein